MKRERFERIMRNLYFSDNDATRAQTAKAWKVRSIVDTLQRTFLSGYTTPPVISFDEAMVPSRSRYNPMRQFMKDKPHRWGTKLFMTCCAQSAYCLRDFHVSAEQTFFKSQVVHAVYDACISGGYDWKCTVEKAIKISLKTRSMQMTTRKKGVYYAVVTDRFYTSNQIALQLLERNVNLVDQEKERLSYDAETKHFEAPEGSTSRQYPTCGVKVSARAERNGVVPQHYRVYVGVWNQHFNRVVSTQTCTITGAKGDHTLPGRHESVSSVYGGVDVHDQLRLQRYSLQLSLRFRKYYKSLALGLIDMAIVNNFIIFHEACKLRGGLQPNTPV
ncbi:hypothetical protein PHMEG_00031272 [Phytophthora megakarya]|uniref:PiggyBac transposable element-derived protein domain-containing protein n=1 Tax=Phytophthora megakarya TaxID=4795 RepID=A0A225V0U6_9STRA|nr:hypothetical protein PHMEG_00031272 [Phytophthora megakarya]